ncbi:MAG: hypothetical protein AB7G47_19945 [Mycolicibacterium sp.]|uniref:hypothetical protein n=1 Tax=Mycolicibacterium sp. TaxID=2320850 RepID=UPI003D0D6DA7
MSIWTMTTTNTLNPESLTGNSTGSDAAQIAALRAVSAANAAAGFEQPRYTVTIDGIPTAIIGTGLDSDGLPDHRGIADLLRRITDSH